MLLIAVGFTGLESIGHVPPDRSREGRSVRSENHKLLGTSNSLLLLSPYGSGEDCAIAVQQALAAGAVTNAVINQDIGFLVPEIPDINGLAKLIQEFRDQRDTNFAQITIWGDCGGQQSPGVLLDNWHESSGPNGMRLDLQALQADQEAAAALKAALRGALGSHGTLRIISRGNMNYDETWRQDTKGLAKQLGVMLEVTADTPQVVGNRVIAQWHRGVP